MKKRLISFAMATLLLAGASQSAAAQARGYVGFGAGLSLPMGDFKDCCKLGWLGQVVAGITGSSGMIGGRIDGMYAANKIKGASSTYSAGTVKLFGANADIVLTPGKRPAKVHPYFLGGVGFYNAKSSGDGVTKFAFNLGAGLQFHTGNQMSVFTEARFISIQTDPGKTNFIPISIGLRWGGI